MSNPRFGFAVLCLLGATTISNLPARAAAPEAPAQAVQQVQPDQAVAILGRTVATPDGHAIGRLVDVLVDTSGTPVAAVLDFGGFMGVGSRKVAVHWSTLQFTPSNRKQPITLKLTPDQIKAVPEYRDATKAAPVAGAPSSPPAASGSP